MAQSVAKRFLFGLWEILEVVIISLATVLFIRFFLFQPFLVSGASMEPNLQNDQYLIVDELSYRLQEPHRGDIVVFRYSKDAFFIKRIIGLPGERIMNEGGVVKVRTTNGEEIVLKEAYLDPLTKTPGNFSVELGADEYFAMGDNREHSYDSRSVGAIKRDAIVGIARLRIFPLRDLGVISRPTY